MNQNNCFYCIKDERLSNLMIPVCAFSTSTLYLFKDQRYPGRCVLACDKHYNEIFELSYKERETIMQDLSKVSKALKLLFHADKINLAVYGDLVSHFHVHIVPKTRDGFEWGKPFSDEKEKHFLEDAEYQDRINKIKMALQDIDI